jgi:hypothetical protein
MGAVSQLSGEFDIKVVANYLLANPAAFGKLNAILDAIDKNKGKLEISVLTTFLDPKIMGAIDQTFFNNLGQAERLVYTQTVSSLLVMEPPKVVETPDFKIWKAEAGPYGGQQYAGTPHSVQWWAQTYANLSAKKFVVENPALVQTLGGTPKPTGTTQRDTTFDSILNDLKRTRDATINATGGAKELLRILSGKKDLTLFKGIDQQLSKLGANSDFIDFIGGLDKAIQNKLITVSKKGVVALTDLGKATKKAFDEKQLGLFSAKSATAITQSIKQRTGFVQLRAAGVQAADALQMVADAEFMISLAAQKNPDEIKRLVAEWKTMQREIEMTIAATDPQQYFDNQMAIAEKQLSYQEAMARRTYEPQIAATQALVDANNVLIEQNQRKLEMDATYGSRRVDSINAEIDALNRQLATGIDKTIQGLSDQSAKLSEDQTLIGHAVDAINQKYDLQEQALSKISDLNQEIIAEKKTQISLADALTQGDISAAAQAVQDVRAASASRAQQLASDAMTAARNAEINAVKGPQTGLTATQINESQYLIDRQQYALAQQRATVESQIAAKQEQIYQIDLLRKPIIAEITRLEDLNYNYTNKTIPDLQNKLNLELAAVEAQRTKWTDAQLAIDNANLSAKDFQDKLDKANTLVGTLKTLWGDITDKNLKLTITTIEQVIQQQQAFTKAGTVTTQDGSSIPVDSSGRAADGTMPIAASKSSIAVADSQPTYNQQREAQIKAAADAAAAAAAKPKTLVPGTGIYLGSMFIPPQYKSMGGVIPKYFASGGYSRGTDTIPAMLTPGEFVMNKNAVDSFGVNNLNKINNGASTDSSVYNYNVGINVTNANADSNDIARAVIGQIKYIDAQRIRGQR